MCEIILVSQTILLILMISGYFYCNHLRKGELADLLDDLKHDIDTLHEKFDKMMPK